MAKPPALVHDLSVPARYLLEHVVGIELGATALARAAPPFVVDEHGVLLVPAVRDLRVPVGCQLVAYAECVEGSIVGVLCSSLWRR